MPFDQNSEEHLTDESTESGNISLNSNYWSFVRRRLLPGLPYRGAIRFGHNSFQRFVESDDERLPFEDSAIMSTSQRAGQVRDAQTNTTPEDADVEVLPRGFVGYSLIPQGTRVMPLPSFSQRSIPSSVSLTPSEMPLDLHPFLLNPPSSESLFPCPEQWNETMLQMQETASQPSSQQSGIRRRYVDVASSRLTDSSSRTREDGSLWGGRSTSRRRLNRWPGFEVFENTDSRSEEKDLDYSIPAFTSFLEPGQEFKGFQRCCTATSRRGGGGDREGNEFINGQGNDWAAHVKIKEYNPSRGYLCGTVEAYVEPGSPVVTFWEGEIIDNKNHTFRSDKWLSSSKADLDYWSRFSSFRNLNRPPSADVDWMCPVLKEYPYIFMRWKETFFIKKPEESSLNIQGFYYISLCRKTGKINGYYCDPGTNPFQELELFPVRHEGRGFCFSHYQFR